ncbi:MAG: AAA family ATPase, partial [Methanomicrobiales archaeon]|nr:AAA family ATPase [Methanomicrobiales archaeon]
MQLDRLQMRNFKRYRDQEIQFKDGITGILGNNGTGKSTIVDAILFCLFGVKETGLEYLISATAGRRDKVEVRLDFSVRGEEYQVVRSLDQKKKHDVEIHKARKLLARGVSDVQDALRRVIRMGHADFRHTIFSGQKELLTLVEATPEERKRWFRRVLGIDSLKEEGGEILREEIRNTRDRVLQIKGRLEGVDETDILKQLDKATGGKAQAEKEMIRLEEEERALRKTIGSLDEEQKGLRERETKDHSTRALIRARDEEAAGVDRELGRIRREMAALSAWEEEWRTVSAKESSFEAEKENYNASKERARTYQDLIAREGDKRERLNECERDLAHFREDANRLGRDEELILTLAPVIARRSAIQSRLEELGGLEERYRVLSERIDQKEGTLMESRRQGRDLRSRIEKLKKDKERLRTLAAAAGVLPDELEDPIGPLDRRRRDLLHIIADATATRDQATRRKEDLEKDLATLEVSGPGGACPTCRQPLGRHYLDLVGDLRQGIGRERENILRLNGQIRKAEGEISSLEGILKDARELLDTTSPLGEISARWEEVQERSLQDISEKEELQKERAALGYDANERNAHEKELASLENQWKEHLAATERLKGRPALDRAIQDLEKRRGRLKDEMEAVTHEREKLGFDPATHELLKQEFQAAERNHARYLELKSRLDHIPVLQKQEEDLKAQASKVRQILGELHAELLGIAFSADDLGRVDRDLQVSRQQLLQLGQHRERSRSEMAHREEEQERLTAMLERREKDREKHDRLSEEIRMLELTRDQLNGFTDHLLGVVRDQIQDETGRILSEITDGHYDTVILDDNFELLVHDLGGDFPVSRFSGGEQDDVAIALRIALSRYIAEMHELHDSTFLIFDEIFGSQDEERRGNIFRA